MPMKIESIWFSKACKYPFEKIGGDSDLTPSLPPEWKNHYTGPGIDKERTLAYSHTELFI